MSRAGPAGPPPPPPAYHSAAPSTPRPTPPRPASTQPAAPLHHPPRPRPPTQPSSIFQITWQWPPSSASILESNTHASFMYVPILAHALGHGHLYAAFPCQPNGPVFSCSTLGTSIRLHDIVAQQMEYMQENFPGSSWSNISDLGYVQPHNQESYTSEDVHFKVDCVIADMRLRLHRN